ncbi:hypothetical protein DL765_001864 [Monosporascus sp. GIB2]|nr:hypothetical protein DL765_001864 [Monosporascus sp. GIB2]
MPQAQLAQATDLHVGAPGNIDVAALGNDSARGGVGATGAGWVMGPGRGSMGGDITFSISDYQSFTLDCRGIY